MYTSANCHQTAGFKIICVPDTLESVKILSKYSSEGNYKIQNDDVTCTELDPTSNLLMTKTKAVDVCIWCQRDPYTTRRNSFFPKKTLQKCLDDELARQTSN